MKKTLGVYKGLVDNVVLGCTHYPLIQKEIGLVLGNDIKYFNGANKLAIHLKEVLKEKDLLNKNIEKNNDYEEKIKFIDSTGNKKKEDRFYELLNN